MNPDAIEWLENLSHDQRYSLFTPVVANEGIAQVKEDHLIHRGECRFCSPAWRSNTLVVVA